MKDLLVKDLIDQEIIRQTYHIELIASENFVSQDILSAVGSTLTNKYAEGYPGKRYYGGCEYIDKIEQLAIDRCKALFHCDHANVQPHSGSQANMGVYMAILEPGDIVLGMDLNSGGHLTHGHPLSFSGKLYQFHGYGVDKETEVIDYGQVRELALQLKPKLIVAGASAYTRIIDFAKFRAICDEVGAYLMVDMAHIAGLVATGLHPSPIPYADFVTSTTHKTLRGPRGGIILCKAQHQAMLDKRIFPGIQGGPLEHVIAGKAICFYEALQPEFRVYQQQVLNNVQAMVDVFRNKHIPLVSGGSDNHMLLVNVKNGFGLTGKAAELLLEQVGITCNKNSIPFDEEKPGTTSGIRIGSAAMTTRGFKESEFKQVALWIIEVLSNPNDKELMAKIGHDVKDLTAQYPIVR
jgi:glycine hydroxymethyltransferase